MAVRNSWFTAVVDGRANPLASGPRRKDGGMHIQVAVRDRGESVTALYVRQYVDADGTIVLAVSDHTGAKIHQHRTER